MTPDQYTLYIILACVIAIIYSLRRIYTLESRLVAIDQKLVKALKGKRK